MVEHFDAANGGFVCGDLGCIGDVAGGEVEEASGFVCTATDYFAAVLRGKISIRVIWRGTSVSSLLTMRSS